MPVDFQCRGIQYQYCLIYLKYTKLKKIISDFFGNSNLKKFDVLASGPNNINVSFYMNHSNKPNIDIIERLNSNYMGFITNKSIKKGDELTINYNSYD